MAEQLTRQQEQAVNDRGGKLLVSAAAGSGKTKVLVDRLLKYIMNPDDPADTSNPLHSATFDADERCFETGIALFVNFVLDNQDGIQF